MRRTGNPIFLVTGSPTFETKTSALDLICQNSEARVSVSRSTVTVSCVQGIVHRDLKPDNLLLAGDKRTVVVSDFGVSRIEASAVMTAETGTYRWMAPEMIDHRPYTRKVDVYSFAVVLWELYTMQMPFAGMSAVQAAFAVINKVGGGPSQVASHRCLLSCH